MIPKVIHFCWFGKTPIPHSHANNIRQWKIKLPGYTFQLWNERNFDVNLCTYSREAYKAKKYAYVADVARCYILKNYGGIYLDTDVELVGSFESYSEFSLFSAIEVYKQFYEIGISCIDEHFKPLPSETFVPFFGFLSSVLGSEKENALISDCLAYYLGLNIDEKLFKGFAIDGLLAHQAVKYGFEFRDTTQLLENNMLILQTGIFGYADSITPGFEVLYHHNAGSWADLSDHKKMLRRLDSYGLLGLYTKVKKLLKR